MVSIEQLPERIDLVFRVGFAGNRDLAGQSERLDEALDRVLATIASTLQVILPPFTGQKPCLDKIANFYSQALPKLRLITGLAEGADEQAALALERLAVAEKKRGQPKLRTELAAILPFDAPTYRRCREPKYQTTFDQRHGECVYVVELDGIYDKSPNEPPIYRHRRECAYRMQSVLLLRQIDLLIAAANRDAIGKPGGTLETISEALEFGTPVIFIDLTPSVEPHKYIRAIEPGKRFRDALNESEPELPWDKALTQWVQRILADPDFAPDDPPPGFSHGWLSAAASKRRHSAHIIDEYLSDQDSPPTTAECKRKASLREMAWTWFNARFHDGKKPQADKSLEPFSRFRNRATNLNYHFTGLYRGAFLLNYTLGFFAVLLAALSLVLLIELTDVEGDDRETLGHTLLILAAIKLIILAGIAWNTFSGNREEWNDKAIDYRYLAERLRTMLYLPRLGSFRSPAAAPVKYASRFARQSGVNWLFDAICRSVSPARFAQHTCQLVPGNPETPTLRVDFDAVLTDVRERWLGSMPISGGSVDTHGSGQILYHLSNAKSMHRMNNTLEWWAQWLSLGVIAVVLVDLFVDLAGIDEQHLLIRWLVFIATLTPAAVASLNGLRFQSECSRLADRSAAILSLLQGQADKTNNLQVWIAKNREDPAKCEGSYAMRVLYLVESTAEDLVEEVSEWSVLYAKDVTHT